MEYEFGEDKYVIIQDFNDRIKYEKWSKMDDNWIYQESFEIPNAIFKKYLKDIFGCEAIMNESKNMV